MKLFSRKITATKWNHKNEVIKVADHRRYDHYDEKTYLFYDISILTLEDKIKVSNKVMPVCLPSMRRKSMYDNRNAQVMGWGLIR